jgi:hypothetical protein
MGAPSLLGADWQCSHIRKFFSGFQNTSKKRQKDKTKKNKNKSRRLLKSSFERGRFYPRTGPAASRRTRHCERSLASSTASRPSLRPPRGEDGGRAAGKDGGRAAGKDGGRAAGKDGGRAAGKDGGRAAGKDGGRAAGKESTSRKQAIQCMLAEVEAETVGGDSDRDSGVGWWWWW